MIGIGWIHTFDGRVGICLGWLLLGAVAWVILSLGRGMLHRQTIREFGRWMLLFAGFCIAPPLLALIAVMSVEVVHRVPVATWPVGAVVAGGLRGVSA